MSAVPGANLTLQQRLRHPDGLPGLPRGDSGHPPTSGHNLNGYGLQRSDDGASVLPLAPASEAVRRSSVLGTANRFRYRRGNEPDPNHRADEEIPDGLEHRRRTGGGLPVPWEIGLLRSHLGKAHGGDRSRAIDQRKPAQPNRDCRNVSIAPAAKDGSR